MIARLVGQAHGLAAGQGAQIDLPGQDVRATGIGDGLAVRRDGGVPLHGLRRRQQLRTLDCPGPGVQTMPSQGAQDDHKARRDHERGRQAMLARPGAQGDDIGARPGQPIADPRHGIDRETVVEGLRQAAQPADAAVERVLADDSAAPAGFNQLVAGDDLAVHPRQRHQHLHHPRLEHMPA